MKLHIGSRDKSMLIGKYGWEFASELETELLAMYPDGDRDKAVNQYGSDTIWKQDQKHVDQRIVEEEARLEEYFGLARYSSEKMLHRIYDDDPRYTAGQIAEYALKRKEWEKREQSNQTDKMIFDDAVQAEKREKAKSESLHGKGVLE